MPMGRPKQSQSRSRADFIGTNEQTSAQLLSALDTALRPKIDITLMLGPITSPTVLSQNSQHSMSDVEIPPYLLDLENFQR